MNTAEFVAYLAEQLETTKVEAGRLLRGLTDAVHANINKEEIKLAGLGSFSRVKRKARLGRNPQTGEEVKIPAKWALKFRAASALKEAVRKR